VTLGAESAAVARRPDRPLPLRLLLVAEDPSPLKDLAWYLESVEATLERVPDQPAALRALAAGSWDALLLVLEDEPEEQLAWWAEILGRVPSRPRVIALTPAPSMELALRAAHLGVLDVLPLPVGREQFLDALRRVCASRDETAQPLPKVRPTTQGSFEMVSESPAMLGVFRAIAQVAPSNSSVLVVGESGTGKELVARAVHQHGPRSNSPFVAVNCAAIPENLLESELFGHEKGSFTGAVARKIGRFERAHGGTLFLDEIGDMSLALQSKILRAVQEREIERVGGADSIPVDVRLIAATHRDVKALMSQGRFREDLYYRLAVVTIRLPRLAERGDDLQLLTAYFLTAFGQRFGKTFTGISDRALELLRRHEWVGNVRELSNVIERAALLADGPTLRAEHLPEEWRTAPAEPSVADEDRPLASLQEVEARHIARVLAHTRGHIGEAARILGVHRNTLARKIREYGL
jgi:DNA-binding NtrC family response regulator